MRHHRHLLGLAILIVTACGGEEVDPGTDTPSLESAPGTDSAGVPTVASTELTRDQVPSSMQPCFGCHPDEVTTYLHDHGMAGSVGAIDEIPTGNVTNPLNGTRYEISKSGSDYWLTAAFADGGRRVQRLVGRIGAGVLDTSWVGEEVDVLTDQGTGRLFFAPVETITGHGNELSPFEVAEPAAGLDLALTEGCLTCHTDSNLAGLSGAAIAAGSTGDPQIRRMFPGNGLGTSAFAELDTLSCDACHGDPARHLEVMADGFADGFGGDLGLDDLSELTAGRQRDVCARCHLQGDVRIDLVGDELRRDQPLAAQIPVFVPEETLDDYRFVSQIERLALSPCFQGSPNMTCSTCHDAHRGVAAQGTAAFDTTCAGCHDCDRPAELTVEEVTGEAPRTEMACVDCHVRRSQAFDLPHVRSADHYIRRLPPPPEEVPHRQFADPDGDLRLFDDGRLAEVLATPEGERWLAGVEAMGFLTLGRLEDAMRGFDRADGATPAELASLAEHPEFHQTRAMALMASGRFDEAIAAFSAALKIDSLHPGSLLARARLYFDTGNIAGALADSQTLIDYYPKAEQPWELRLSMAERLGRPDLAQAALEESTRRWPSNAASWYKLGLLLEQQGNVERAREAYERAKILQPSLSLPGAGPVADR